MLFLSILLLNVLGKLNSSERHRIALALHLLLLSFIASNVVLAACYVVLLFCFTIALAVLELKELRG